MGGEKRVLLIIRDTFLRYLYKGFFKSNGLKVLEAGHETKMRNILRKECMDLIVFGMHLAEKDIQVLVYKALMDKVPVMILQMDETKDLLEDSLKYDQYVYVDILNDRLSDIAKKARKIMNEYKVKK
ncbi:hypothetical protein CL633_02945 [bacterium]|nr:hypothetical protein [bacterium]|tara:strand:+ start:1544 stop:1924 length:381 start_codon:yes stop_codon:yes gene_type:complete